MTDNRHRTVRSPKTEHLKAFQFKPGVSGNPGGRPKNTLKDFARRYFSNMSEEEKLQFLNSMDKALVWRMSEGNPKIESEVVVDREGLQEMTAFLREMAKPKV